MLGTGRGGARAAEIAHTGDRRVILDPASAPSQPLPHELYGYLTVINPNEVEARASTGIAVTDERGARAAAERLLAEGCRAVVIKLGHGARSSRPGRPAR